MTAIWDGALMEARVWHGRSGDLARQFRYRVTYLALPLADFEADQLPVRPDRCGVWSVRRRDYGARDGTSMSAFIRDLLSDHGVKAAEVALITLPRTLGYGFNPISLWLARDDQGLRAVLAEVSNTFGERHLYLCRHADNRVITESDRLAGDKLFHVSPFLPREGRYVFRFDVRPGRFGLWVDWIGTDGVVRLGTSLTGSLRPLSRTRLQRASLRAPMQAQRVMALIHWQALKLFRKGIRYRTKPVQKNRTRSQVSDTTGGPHV